MPNLLRCLLCCSLAIILNGPNAQCEVVLTQVEVDGKAVLVSPESISRAKPVSILSTAQSLRIRFKQTEDQGRPAARLRYKLEGYDRGWKDLPSSMRGFLEFRNSHGDMLASEEFCFEGESPGWRGTLENSEFQEHSKGSIAPEGASKADVVLMSHGPNGTMGLVGIDDFQLLVASSGSALPKSFDLNAEGLAEFPYATNPSAYWERGGSRASLAQVSIRSRPAPHPILVFNDDAPAHFATWVTRWNKQMPVEVGDKVTIKFKTAYSIGSAGPGVAEFAKLKAGNYFFRVAATRINGEPTGTELVLPILVMDPWYRHWLVWAAMAAMASAGIAWLSRWSLKRWMQRRLAALEHERLMERERERIARDLHDHVGAGLTEIAMQSDWVDGDLEQGVTERTRQRVRAIRNSATELARGVDEMVWAVNPANDNLKRFASYLTQCSAQFLEAADVRVRFDIPAELPDIHVPGKTRHALFLVVREALNNAVKYACARLVRLEMELQPEGLHLAIEDDGQGFEVERSGPEGTGLINMRRRLEEIGGVFTIKSQKGAGTRIELFAPVAQPALTDR